MKKKCYLNPSVQEGAFFLILSGWLLFYSMDAYNKSYIKDWAQSPSLFPVVVSLVMGLLAVILLVQGVRGAQPAKEKTGTQPVQVLILLGMIFAYYAALSVINLPYIGWTIFGMTLSISTFEVTTTLFLLGMMVYLGVRSKAVLAAVPVGATVFLSIMFRTLLRVLLP